MKYLFRFYQYFVSPISHALGKSLFGSSFACRFTPTCSEYSKLAIAKYGIIRGGVLSLRRLSHCHPWSNSPYHDPVP